MRILHWIAGAICSLAGAASGQAYTWTDITPPLQLRSPDTRFAFAVHPLDGRRLMVGIGGPAYNTGAGAVYVTNDAGATWQASTGLPANLGRVERLHAHAALPGVVFMQEGSYLFTIAQVPQPTPGRTFRSDDFGVTWRLIDQATRDVFVVSPFATDPLDANHVFATRRTPGGCGIACQFPFEASDATVVSSRDGGLSWEAAGNGIAFNPANKVLSNPENSFTGPVPAAPSRLFFGLHDCCSFDVLYRSLDSGATWEAWNPSAGPFRWIRQDPLNAGVLFGLYGATRGSTTTYLYRSADAGVTWSVVFSDANTGTPNLAIHPARNQEVWLAGMGGARVLHSRDSGRTWTLAGETRSIFPVSGIWLDPSNARIAYTAVDGKLYRATSPATFDPIIVEFTERDERYWPTSLDGEAVFQDNRLANGAVRRTGLRWGAWRADDAPAGAVGSCRFWSLPASGLRTRVLVQQGFECEILKRDANWTLEAQDEFFTMLPVDGACPGASVPVHRFNNTKADLNHRWVTDASVAGDMRARGWYDEGVRFCARPLGSDE